MRLLAFLFIAAFLLPASARAGQCDGARTANARIEVNLNMPDTAYETSYGWNDLQKKGEQVWRDWLSREGLNPFWEIDESTIAGQAYGGWAALYGMHTYKTQLEDGYDCIFFDKVGVELFYRTQVALPRDYRPGSCRAKIIEAHELKHIAAMRRIVGRETDNLRHDIALAAAQMESSPMSEAEVDKADEQMKQGIRDLVSIYFKERIPKEIEAANARIDTQQDLDARTRAMAACRVERAHSTRLNSDADIGIKPGESSMPSVPALNP
jgi:hypothetical protein